jgi:LacI family transcriptional regulator
MHFMPAEASPTPLPLYRLIYADLERRIGAGELGDGGRLPALPDLCREYGVSAAPVRRALDDLARDGLITRRRGRGQGTFAVRASAPTPALTARLLLLGDFDLERGAIELCHEVFDLIAGLREAAGAAGFVVQQVSRGALGHLPPAGAGTGYLVIAMSSADYAEGARLAAGAPCVLVNPPQASAEGASVRVDMEAGGFLGASHLAALGHRRIAYVGGVGGEWSAPRLSGYRRALETAGITDDPALIRATGGVRADEDAAALDALLALPDPPTAVFASSDYRALHLLAHARARGVAVPWGLSLCGYDDIADAAVIAPALTTVRHPRAALGPAALELLRALLSGEPPAERVVSPELVARASTAAAPRRAV